MSKLYFENQVIKTVVTFCVLPNYNLWVICKILFKWLRWGSTLKGNWVHKSDRRASLRPVWGDEWEIPTGKVTCNNKGDITSRKPGCEVFSLYKLYTITVLYFLRKPVGSPKNLVTNIRGINKKYLVVQEIVGYIW
jgi:hypothetical protein